MLASHAAAADRVKLAQGTSSSGRVTEITPDEVTLESGARRRRSRSTKSSGSNFDSEPTELAQGRVAAHAGRYDDALTLLDKLDSPS